MWEFFQEAKQVLKTAGITIEILIAGLFGGLAFASREKKMSFLEKSVSVIVGGAVANYLTPLIIDWIKMSENSQYGIAFILGYTGLKSVEWVIDKFKSKIDKSDS